MAEELTIKLRTEVEGTEDIGEYRSELAKTKVQTERTAKAAEKAGKQISNSTVNVSRIAQNLGKLSPTLGKVAQSVNRLTASWKRYNAEAKKVAKGDMTNMGQTLGNAKASKASRTATMAKVAGVGLAAGAASMLFNAITGTGSKLAGFDKLNTLGTPSVLDPLIPYLQSIDENTEKTATAVATAPTIGGGPAVSGAVAIAEKALQATMTSNKVSNINAIGNRMSNSGETASKEVPEGFILTGSNRVVYDGPSSDFKSGWVTVGDTQYMVNGGGGLLYNQDGTPATRAAPTQTPQPEPEETDWWNDFTGVLGDIGEGILDGYNTVVDTIADAIPNELAEVSQGASGVLADIYKGASSVGLGSVLLSGPSLSQLTMNELTEAADLPIEEYKRKMSEGVIDTALTVATAGIGVATKGGKAIIQAADKAIDTIKKTTKVAEDATEVASKTATKSIESVSGSGSKVLLKVSEEADDVIKGTTKTAEEAIGASTKFLEETDRMATSIKNRISDALKALKGDDFVDSEGVYHIGRKSMVNEGITLEKNTAKGVTTVDDITSKMGEATEEATKISDKLKNLGKAGLKYGAIGGAMTAGMQAVGGLLSILGFAEGGVFLPNQPQLAVLGDNRSEPEVAAPYSLIVKAVGDAIKSNQSSGLFGGGSSTIEVPVSLNGKVIARAIYNDLENEKRRRNGSVVL